MAKDDLKAFVARRTRANPRFPALVAEAEERRCIARELAAHRAAAVTQTALAEKMGTSQAVVSRVEQGADVRLSTLQKYARALGCELHIGLEPVKRKRTSGRPGRDAADRRAAR